MYKNPIPFILVEDDEPWFFEPITRALNDMAERGIISEPQIDSDYFKITMPVKHFAEFSKTLTDLGVEFAGNCDISYDSKGESLTADMTSAFTDYREKTRQNFFSLLRENSPLPSYLEQKEKMQFCSECNKRNCNSATPYCVRLYTESLINEKGA